MRYLSWLKLVIRLNSCSILWSTKNYSIRHNWADNVHNFIITTNQQAYDSFTPSQPNRKIIREVSVSLNPIKKIANNKKLRKQRNPSKHQIPLNSPPLEATVVQCCLAADHKLATLSALLLHFPFTFDFILQISARSSRASRDDLSALQASTSSPSRAQLNFGFFSKSLILFVGRRRAKSSLGSKLDKRCKFTIWWIHQREAQLPSSCIV